MALQEKNPPDSPPADPFPDGPISFSQVDITETFDDNLRLTPGEWIDTVPLNKSLPDPESVGLPPVDASDELVYEIAAQLSQLRETIPVPDDGVYCPICHIANTELSRLGTRCPKCQRPLLKFGWD